MRYLLDDLIVDTSSQKVWRGQQQLNISGLNFQFLSFLLTKNSTIVTFNELIEGVWGPAIVNEDTVTQRVRLLRGALGDDGRNPRYLRSVRGLGYQLVLSPRVLKDTAKSPAGWVRHKQLALSLTAGAVVACLVVALNMDWQNQADPHSIFSEQSATDKLLERAKYYASIGQHDDNNRAIELFEQVLSQEPDNIDAMLGLSRSYNRDMCRFNAGWQQAEKSEEIARAVLKLEPDNFHAFRMLGHSQGCRGKSQAAEASYLRAIELDQDGDLQSQSALAYLLGEEGRLAEALAMNLNVSQLDPGQTFNLIQVARVYELLGLHPLAERLYQESFELYPDNIFSNLSYPRNLFHQGRFSEARDVLTKARKRPAHPELYVLSAELALLNNDMNLAREELTRASQMRPSSKYFAILVELYDSPQNQQQWITDRLAHIQSDADPNNSWDWIVRAMLYQAQGDLSSGINALSNAVSSGFRNSAYLELSPLFQNLRSASGFEQVILSIKSVVKLELDKVYSEDLSIRPFAKQ